MRFTSNEDSNFHADIELETYIPTEIRQELITRLETWTTDSDLMQWLLDPPIVYETNGQLGKIIPRMGNFGQS